MYKLNLIILTLLTTFNSLHCLAEAQSGAHFFENKENSWLEIPVWQSETEDPHHRGYYDWQFNIREYAQVFDKEKIKNQIPNLLKHICYQGNLNQLKNYFTKDIGSKIVNIETGKKRDKDVIIGYFKNNKYIPVSKTQMNQSQTHQPESIILSTFSRQLQDWGIVAIKKCDSSSLFKTADTKKLPLPKEIENKIEANPQFNEEPKQKAAIKLEHNKKNKKQNEILNQYQVIFNRPLNDQYGISDHAITFLGGVLNFTEKQIPQLQLVITHRTELMAKAEYVIDKKCQMYLNMNIKNKYCDSNPHYFTEEDEKHLTTKSLILKNRKGIVLNLEIDNNQSDIKDQFGNIVGKIQFHQKNFDGTFQTTINGGIAVIQFNHIYLFDYNNQTLVINN